MLTAFAYKDASGRLVPSDEVDEDADPPVLRSGGGRVERVVAKMSKSLKNVVNPDDVCEQYGVDTFRLYEMFMGPLSDSKPWNPRDVPGCRRFLDKLWRLFVDPQGDDPVRPHLREPAAGEPAGDAAELERALARALERIDASFAGFNFNTAVAACMTFVNEAQKRPDALRRDQAERLVLALSPFAPHVCEELWARLGHEGSLAHEPWPTYDPKWLVADEVEFAVQVNGKLRGRVLAPKEVEREALEASAREAAGKHLDGLEVVKTIVVPGRLVNFVAR
jgi:leucyl-tRNA synthetase